MAVGTAQEAVACICLVRIQVGLELVLWTCVIFASCHSKFDIKFVHSRERLCEWDHIQLAGAGIWIRWR